MSTSLVTLDAKIDLNDVVSVRVAEVEQALDAKIQAQREVVTNLKKDQAKINNAISESLKKVIEADFKTRPQAIIDAFKAQKCTLKTTSSNHMIVGNEICYSIGIQIGDQYGSLSLPVRLPFPKKFAELNEEKNEIEKRLDEENKAYIDLMEAKSRISTIERNARAQVAALRLEKTTEGQEILNRLRQSDANKLLLLPPKTV